MSAKPEDYDGDYFIRGRESGKSLYENYRWLPDLTVPMARRIAEHCRFADGQTVLDFGCSRGYLVRALRSLGYDASGADVSRWALENADPEARDHCCLVDACTAPIRGRYDWIVAKDVLEHVEYVRYVVANLMAQADRGVFAVVPLTLFDNGAYVVEDYELDVTHCQRWTLPAWAEMFIRPGWRVEVSYRLKGVKDNYFKPEWAKGNGFLTARRIDESD